MTRCRVCGNDKNNQIYTAREMMFGFRDKFQYIKCAECGCLQIRDIPESLSKYYPDTYYSFRDKCYKRQDSANKFSKAQQTDFWLHGKNIVGMACAITRKKDPPYFIDWFKGGKIGLRSKILDIGSGAGGLLIDMHHYGFSDLTGIDPFIGGDVTYDNGLRILRKEVYDLDQMFDYIILNGSFEHMPEPLRVLKKVHDILKPGNHVLLRIPLTDSYAWREYGTDWVQLDAPRHLFLHTLKSMRFLADKAGFYIRKIVFDSYDLQFWGSEQYAKGISLFDPSSYMVDPKKSLFSGEQIADFKNRSDELNRKNDGDQAIFYLHKTEADS